VSVRGFFAALIPALAAAAAPWDEEPAPGSRFDTLDHQRYACAARADQIRCRLHPGQGIELGGIAALGRTLVYREDRLVSGCTLFDERRFGELLSSIEASHGPAEHSTELLRAGMGGVFSNALAVWRPEGKIVLLEEHFERVTQSAVCVMEPEFFSAQSAARDRQRVRGVRDL